MTRAATRRPPARLARLKQRLQAQWRGFKRSRPGQRFEDYHERQRRARQKGFSWGRPIRWVLSAVCLAIGVVLSIMPGPAFIFYGLAGALLASDSRPIARAMDWCEVKARRVALPLAKKWRRLRPGFKAALVSAGAVLGAFAIAFLWMQIRRP